jgi:hypothetical protein
MENEHILTVEEFRALARPTSKHLEEDEVKSYIGECEDVFIIPAVGLDKFQALLADELSEDDKILLSGGTFESKDGKKIKCAGLKKSLAYFVYGKLSMGDGSIITRSGYVQHNDSYAARTDDKNRVRRYDDVMNVAEQYLNSCLTYLKTLTGYKDMKPVRGTRVHIHAIGD